MEPKILLKDNTGKVIMELAKPDLSQVYAAGWKKPENFVVKAADNVTDLYGVMWKPSNFDPERNIRLFRLFIRDHTSGSFLLTLRWMIAIVPVWRSLALL